jgi:hypothetical protein
MLSAKFYFEVNRGTTRRRPPSGLVPYVDLTPRKMISVTGAVNQSQLKEAAVCNTVERLPNQEGKFAISKKAEDWTKIDEV